MIILNELISTQVYFKGKKDMDRKYLHAVKGDNSSKFDENGRKISENRILMLSGIFFLNETH